MIIPLNGRCIKFFLHCYKCHKRSDRYPGIFATGYHMPMKKIIDVRTPAEYALGHVPGSVNIPLQELADRKDELIALNQALIFCCASGVRSAKAVTIGQEFGLHCENGGGWQEVLLHWQDQNQGSL